MIRKYQPGCPCPCGGAGCSVSLTANARACSLALPGTLIELLDAAMSGVLDSGTGSSKIFTIDGTLAYNIRISKLNYCTKIFAIAATGCTTPISRNYNTWPSTYTQIVNVRTQIICPLPGATVTITGGGTGTAITDASGVATITVTTSCSNQIANITITVTPPSGYGANGSVTTVLSDPCSPTARTINLLPSSGHVAVVCGSRYMPDTFAYSDDFGACTLTFLSGSWRGSYVYASTNAIDQVACPGPSNQLIANLSRNINVVVILQISSGCSNSSSTMIRGVLIAEGRTGCGLPANVCQVSAFGTPGTEATSSENFTMNCSTTAISRYGSIPALTNPSVPCVYSETAVSYTLTGTV